MLTRGFMSQQFRSLSAPGRAYVLVVSAIGLAIAVGSLAQVFVQQVNVQWLILAALTLLTGIVHGSDSRESTRGFLFQIRSSLHQSCSSDLRQERSQFSSTH